MIEPQPPQPFPLSNTHNTPNAADTPPPASAFGRYRIRREIGRGFSSVVYEAIDSLRERPVALKVLTLDQSLTEARRADMAERFLREARAISALSHPGIVAIYEIGQAGDGRHFIAMELLRGEALRARLDREGALAPEEAVPIAQQVADALEYAHVRGIIHRDVKPDNIFVLPDGRAKLMDFGVAHIFSEGALTQTGTVVGSPAYMSPEQISGQLLGGRSDVFSLGVTLAEALTGHKPFDAPTIPAVMNRILHRPAQVENVQPRSLRKVLDKALAKNPQARFPTAAAFAEALRRQVAPLLPTSSTSTVIMSLPLIPAPRPLRITDSLHGTSGAAQEPPSRAALWTAGLAGLAAVAVMPLLLSRMAAPTLPAPVAGAHTLARPAIHSVPPPVRLQAQHALVAHIPLAWRRHAPVRRAVARVVVAQSARRKPAPRPVVRSVEAPVVVQPGRVLPHTIRLVKRPVPHTVVLAKHPTPPLPTPIRLAAAHHAPAFALQKHTLVAARLPATAHVALTSVLAPRPPAAYSPRVPRHDVPRPALVKVADARQEQRVPAPPSASVPTPVAPAPTPPPAPLNLPPRLLRRTPAVYPADLRDANVRGTVTMRLSISAEGRVTEATVTQSSGADALDSAALDAVGNWHYAPAVQNGQAVPATAIAVISFP